MRERAIAYLFSSIGSHKSCRDRLAGIVTIQQEKLSSTINRMDEEIEVWEYLLRLANTLTTNE